MRPSGCNTGCPVGQGAEPEGKISPDLDLMILRFHLAAVRYAGDDDLSGECYHGKAQKQESRQRVADDGCDGVKFVHGALQMIDKR